MSIYSTTKELGILKSQETAVKEKKMDLNRKVTNPINKLK